MLLCVYTPHETKGLGTISDAKSHMAPATWVSLNEMMQFIDLEDTEKLYIASDSPSSQYRNKNNILLTKDWAIKNKIHQGIGQRTYRLAKFMDNEWVFRGQRSKYRNVPLFTVNDKNTEFDQYLEKRLTNRNSLFYSRITN